MFGSGVSGGGGGGGGGGGSTNKHVQIIGDGVAKTFVIQHDLGTEEVIVSTVNIADKHVVYPDVFITNENSVTIGVVGFVPAAGSLRVTVIG
jgi:hypothetical protein